MAKLVAKKQPTVKAVREHEIHCGHRVVGHKGKCRHLHGHGYVFKFYCEANQLDEIGMVIDFGVIKTTLCQWLEDNWDHKTLLWKDDPLLAILKSEKFSELVTGGVPNPTRRAKALHEDLIMSWVEVPFNPTAENIGLYMLNYVGPTVLSKTGIRLTKVEVNETRKCSAIAEC